MSKQTVQCISPIDGSVVAERPLPDSAGIQAAFAAARRAGPDWRSVPLAGRAKLCTAAVDAMLGMRDEIIPELARQMGRPVRYGAGELAGFEERARHMISIAESTLTDIVPDGKDGFKRYIQRTPLGVVFTIAPWNYPYLTAVNSVIPALMAGNTVVLKHSASTLLAGERFASAFASAGLPEGVFGNILMDHDQTAAAIGSGLADCVCFTGSVDAGRAIEKSAGGLFIPVGLELGGKDPAYVRADADLEFAIENVADGAFFNSGQSCCGIERVYVQRSVYDDFIDGIAKVAGTHVLGNPLDADTTMGPMIRPGAADFVRRQVAEAAHSGGVTLVDSTKFELDVPGSTYLAPQVVVDVNHSMSLMREESFGPVVGVMPVESDDEAVAFMNDSEFGLTASIWTRDVEAAEAIGRRLETGTVFMNRCDYLDPALAWTGVKNTGRGCTLSRIGYEALTRPKSFHLRTAT